MQSRRFRRLCFGIIVTVLARDDNSFGFSGIIVGDLFLEINSCVC